MARKKINFDSLKNDRMNRQSWNPVSEWDYYDANHNLKNIYKEKGFFKYFFFSILLFVYFTFDKEQKHFAKFPTLWLKAHYVVGMIGFLVASYFLLRIGIFILKLILS